MRKYTKNKNFFSITTLLTREEEKDGLITRKQKIVGSHGCFSFYNSDYIDKSFFSGIKSLILKALSMRVSQNVKMTESNEILEIKQMARSRDQIQFDYANPCAI